MPRFPFGGWRNVYIQYQRSFNDTRTVEFPLDGLKNGLLHYQRSSIVKPMFYKIAFQYPTSVALDPNTNFKVKYAARTLRFLAHGPWAHATLDDKFVLSPEDFVPKVLTINDLKMDYFMNQEDISLEFWPNLLDARNMVEASGFHGMEFDRHKSGLPRLPFLALPIHVLLNMDKAFGIALDDDQPAYSMMDAVRIELESNKSRLEISDAFSVESTDVELKFCSSINGGNKILKEIRLWLDGDLSKTIDVPSEYKYGGVNDMNEMVKLPSIYPSTTMM